MSQTGSFIDVKLLSERRGTVKLMIDILRITSNGALKTEIVYRANLNFRQARKYLDFLLSKGLITVDVSVQGKKRYQTTKKGKAFIKHYKKALELIS